jgi:hypothetical protein
MLKSENDQSGNGNEKKKELPERLQIMKAKAAEQRER